MTGQGQGRAARTNNNFGALRLLAAGLVLVAHSWKLTGRAGPTVGGDTLGGVGVAIFFAISGYLVCQSWHSDPRVGSFLAKRALRILPALFVAVVFSAYLVGPAFSELPLNRYLLSPDTLSYVWHNSVLSVTFTLPGVFTHNITSAVNGSLWTLPVEIRSYALIAALGCAGLLRRPYALVAAAIGLVLLASPAFITTGTGQALGTVLTSGAGLRFVAIFCAGATLYLVRARVPLDGRLAVGCAGAFLFSAQVPALGQLAIWTICVPYVVAFVAFRGPAQFRRLVRPGDASYGVYLYGFVIEQSLLAVEPGVSPLLLLLQAAPLAYLAGLTSWRLIEAPALRLKRVLPSRAALSPVGAVTEAPAPAA